MIYPILAKYQSSSLPREMRFEQSIEDIDSTMKPYVNLTTEFYEDIASEQVISDSEQRTVSDIEYINSGNDTLKRKYISN